MTSRFHLAISWGEHSRIGTMAYSSLHPASSERLERGEGQWVEEIRSGSPVAFEALFRSYSPRLCRFALRMIGSRMDAEDLVQEVFVKLWERRADWSPAGSVKAYLYRAVKNQAINYLKRQEILHGRNEVELDEVFSMQPGPEEELYRKEIETAVQEAIELLPPRCRLIFVLHRLDGLRYGEITRVLDISIKTVETQMGRALKTLRRLLVHHLPTLGLLLSLRDMLS